MNPRTKTPQAFSLSELSILIAIIGVVAAMAAPRYANSLALYRVQATAQRIASDVNLARWQAKISSSGQSIVFNATTNSYSLPAVNGLSGQPSPYSVSLSNDPYQAKLQSAAFSNSATLTFDRFGQPAAGGSVAVQCGGYTKTISVDPNTGLTSVQ